MVLALTLALPGTPVLLYGDEIGMGEDLSLPGRLAVRNPMHGRPGPPAASPPRPDVPAGASRGTRRYRMVNAADQRHEPGSLLVLGSHRSGCAARARSSAGRVAHTRGRRPARARHRDTRRDDQDGHPAQPLGRAGQVRLPGDLDQPPRAEKIRQVLGDTDPPYSAGENRPGPVRLPAGCAGLADGGRLLLSAEGGDAGDGPAP